MKQYFQKLKKTIEENALGLELAIFIIILTEFLHFLKYSEFSVDFMGVEFMAICFFVLILNLYQEEKNKKKFVLKTVGLVVLFSVIVFQIMFDYIFGENFACSRCDGFFEAILK
ncbi:hypothetical protein A3H03_02810 [Candidatus Kuenenbacteria bacterium RIFCSPLOWO2_12_FULL_42_13]|uniref:Uncharacterized protein n=4 Tax=Candidatus Kueneniibacteriota TaxID=1752740 RepID=A0A0G0YSD9_9BACT|nr:MAG: hypothetical protein UV02_C0067G0002 [Candidatus Kuenenbacteria bacterium GW2011_GWA2_42_15]OGG90421.1 MAG: hypothetical protein A3H55_03580 [Candidatus Kuenenbacteria bacterium RIFCSPLOWO2_02_FULL_42_16]OGG91892.1 MAG: hypothetical protein A3H03_02810 [Candidatus Kuenenbacteria bacterium RIFCSPLOWO2_12_FULL_42_13]OGG95868.1 MAG: hypothetical protein A2V95_01810 [Candidatus Kuenenbacteria bacterium RBG_16_41_7]